MTQHPTSHDSDLGLMEADLNLTVNTIQPLSLKPRADFTDPENTKKLAEMVMRMFSHWKLSAADQLQLLGLSPSSRSMLSRYRTGKAVPSSPDMLDRIGWLLSIHKNLRTLYPENKEICYSWIKLHNQFLGNWTPLEIMKRQRLLGIHRIAKLLDQLVTM